MSTLIESSSEPRRSLGLHLANGLRLRLVHRPDTELCAALVEVSGGSHDEPAEYPGLAHFIEHLVFLCSREFPPDQGLIPFVQGLGGRVNASTRARSTRFFCEVPAAHLDQALARLMDMLANPLLETAALWRERDVLQAEYSARARDPDTLCEAALAWALAPGHPLADFHAGNAASLKLESPGFIAALQRFHQDHYQPGRMCLTLVAPQTLEQQLELARRHGEPLQAGRRLPEPAVPPMLPLRARRLRLGLPGGCARLVLAFALERQGAGLEAAVALLGNLLRDDAPGGLQARLGLLELSDGLQLRLPYDHGGQGLLLMEFELVDGADCAQLEAEVLDWLAFLRAAAPWPGLWEERLGFLRRKTAELDPLDAAMAPGFPEPADLLCLLDQLRAEHLLRLETGAADGVANLESAGFPLDLERLDVRPGARSGASWRLPPVNPYLRPIMPATPAMASLVPMRPGLADAPGQGALFLRWSPGGGGLPHGLAHALQRALRPALGGAALAGVEGCLQAEQGGLTLELLGNAQLLRQVIGDLLPILRAPPPWTLAQGPRLQRSAMGRQAGELPIRQLLQRLPDLLVSAPDAPAVLDPQALARFWWQARWQGLGIGDVALDCELPDQPATLRAAVGEAGRIWHRLDIEGEAALLLFYPLESPSPRAEAAGRLLASVLEPAFHQRLRGELQLGYALACGFRQMGGHRGLLFAVQSPRASVAGLCQHIEDFLAGQYERLARLEQTQLHDPALCLDQQLTRQGTRFAAYARQCWIDHLACLPAEHPAQVRQALAELRPADLLEQHERLIAGLSCHALANAKAPDSSWRRRA